MTLKERGLWELVVDVLAKMLEGKRKKSQIRHVTDGLMQLAQLANKQCQGMKFTTTGLETTILRTATGLSAPSLLVTI